MKIPIFPDEKLSRPFEVVHSCWNICDFGVFAFPLGSDINIRKTFEFSILSGENFNLFMFGFGNPRNPVYS